MLTPSESNTLESLVERRGLSDVLAELAHVCDSQALSAEWRSRPAKERHWRNAESLLRTMSEHATFELVSL